MQSKRLLHLTNIIILILLVTSCGDNKLPNRFYLKSVEVELVTHQPANNTNRNIVIPYNLNDTSRFIGLRFKFNKEYYYDSNTPKAFQKGYYGTHDTIINFSILLKTQNDSINITNKFRGIEKITNNFEYKGNREHSEFFKTIHDFKTKFNLNSKETYGTLLYTYIYFWVSKEEINGNMLNVVFETKDSLKVQKTFILR